MQSGPAAFSLFVDSSAFFTFSTVGTGSAGPGSKSKVSLSVLVYRVSQYFRHLSSMSALSVSVPPFCYDITLTLEHAFFVNRLTFWNKSFDLFFLPVSSISSHILFKRSALSCAYFSFQFPVFWPVSETIAFLFNQGKSLGLDPLFFHGPDLFA